MTHVRPFERSKAAQEDLVIQLPRDKVQVENEGMLGSEIGGEGR